jgi:mono/diheme cytochrome c family protein
MKREFKTWVILLAFSIPLVPMLFIAVIYFTNCGINNNCAGGNLSEVIHTPIPTLVPATLPAPTLGKLVLSPSATPVQAAAGGIPRPSKPGGPGQAVTLTSDPAAGAAVFAANCATCHGEAGKGGVSNPGSERGVVPTLNPIEPALKGKDAGTFASNIDLFIQHGSTPKGANPFRTMPAWGDQNVLTQQQIADVIAYLISLNK